MFKRRHSGYLPWLVFAFGVSVGILLYFLLLSLPEPGPSLIAMLGLLALMVLGHRLYRTELVLLGNDIQVVRHRFNESEQRFRALLENLPRVAVQGYDSERRVLYWNEASRWLYGYTSREAMGRPLEELLIPDAMREKVIAAHRAWVEEGKRIPASELELRHKSGALVPVFSHHVMLGEHSGNPLMFCVDIDLSDQKQARRELEFATRFDALTSLPNRRTFEAELAYWLSDARRCGDGLAVVLIDIDDFTEINAAQGYAQGDALLIQVAERLSCHQHGQGILARFDRDDFIMALPCGQKNDDAIVQVEAIMAEFERPFAFAGNEFPVTASVGVSLFPDDGTTEDALIHHADVAKNHAKHAGRKCYRFFTEQFQQELLRRHELARRLREALVKDELTLHYQPQVAPASGRVESFEALLRWLSPQGVVATPEEIIAVAEHAGLIHALGDWVVQTACRQQSRWKRLGMDDRRIDINLAGGQLSDASALLGLEACLEKHQLTPQDIGIELTENVLIQAHETILTELWRLYHRGMKIAIDDFGTGYSSLNYLKNFPVTSIKIDKSFVGDAPVEPRDRSIMEAMVFIGHRLGLEVIAEGVEHADQLALVREIGCDLVQGYYFFKPMSGDAVNELLGLTEAREMS